MSLRGKSGEPEEGGRGEGGGESGRSGVHVRVVGTVCMDHLVIGHPSGRGKGGISFQCRDVEKSLRQAPLDA